MTNLTTYQQREEDVTLLATIAGDRYYELRQIVRERDGVREVVGLASAWPVISRDARIAELEALLTAEQRHAEEAEARVAELLAKQEAAVPPAMAAAALGLEPTAEPTPAPVEQHTCSDCGKAFAKERGLLTHRSRFHRSRFHRDAYVAERQPEPLHPLQRRGRGRGTDQRPPRSSLVHNATARARPLQGMRSGRPSAAIRMPSIGGAVIHCSTKDRAMTHPTMPVRQALSHGGRP